jgi:peptide methionine sulfoxide reductase MsrB
MRYLIRNTTLDQDSQIIASHIDQRSCILDLAIESKICYAHPGHVCHSGPKADMMPTMRVKSSMEI